MKVEIVGAMLIWCVQMRFGCVVGVSEVFRGIGMGSDGWRRVKVTR